MNLLRWLPIKYDADRAIKMTNPHKFPAGSTFFGQFQPSDTARRRHLHCLVMNVNNVAASAVLAQRPRIFPTCSDPLFFIFQVSEMFIGPRNLICAFELSFHEFPLIKVGKLNGAICQITRSWRTPQQKDKQISLFKIYFTITSNHRVAAENALVFYNNHTKQFSQVCDILWHSRRYAVFM